MSNKMHENEHQLENSYFLFVLLFIFSSRTCSYWYRTNNNYSYWRWERMMKAPFSRSKWTNRCMADRWQSLSQSAWGCPSLSVMLTSIRMLFPLCCPLSLLIYLVAIQHRGPLSPKLESLQLLAALMRHCRKQKWRFQQNNRGILHRASTAWETRELIHFIYLRADSFSMDYGCLIELSKEWSIHWDQQQLCRDYTYSMKLKRTSNSSNFDLFPALLLSLSARGSCVFRLLLLLQRGNSIFIQS